MIVIFTLCSANYLAHAKTLGDSLKENNPDYHFVIGLVDCLSKDIAPEYWQPSELMPVEDLGIPNFGELAAKYNLVELNTAVKPFYIDYLYHRNPTVDAVIYLDPDILICSSLQHIVEKLRTSSLVVTPHSCTYDNSSANLFYETAMLGTGIYNLGFLATSRCETTFTFLQWWQRRLRDYCYYGGGLGMFVDQIWLTLAPLYFSGIYVERDPGYNMCYWNHFERRLDLQNGRFTVNGKCDLVFYHFSSYDPNNPGSITKRPVPHISTFTERPDLKSLYDNYRSRLLANRYEEIRFLPYRLSYKSREAKSTVRGFLKKAARRGLRGLPHPIRTRIKRLADFAARTIE